MMAMATAMAMAMPLASESSCTCSFHVSGSDISKVVDAKLSPHQEPPLVHSHVFWFMWAKKAAAALLKCVLLLRRWLPPLISTLEMVS